MDEVNAKLLDRLQAGIPLVNRPFAAIADALSLREADVMERVAALRNGRGIIRQISAIFDSRSLGYESCLVAAKVDEARIDEAAAVISLHPGVSHNYRRNHAYNLWYTVAVPPDSRLGLQKTVDILHQRSGASVTRLMPALRMFKIGVKFNLSDEAPPATTANVNAPGKAHLTDRDQRMIRVLQQDMPMTAEPFNAWAQQANVSVEHLLDAARAYLHHGLMRRFSAVLRHREAGFGANAMGAWVVPADLHEKFGQTAAAFNEVSHCYLRPTYPDWPYSLFTMVHGREPAQCEAVLAQISSKTGISEYAALYSTHEFKKVRVKYFAGDIEAWEREAVAISDVTVQ